MKNKTCREISDEYDRIVRKKLSNIQLELDCCMFKGKFICEVSFDYNTDEKDFTIFDLCSGEFEVKKIISPKLPKDIEKLIITSEEKSDLYDWYDYELDETEPQIKKLLNSLEPIRKKYLADYLEAEEQNELIEFKRLEEKYLQKKKLRKDIK